MPKSARLASIEAGKKKEAEAHAKRNRQEQRREPRKCTECSKRAARHGCHYCQRCYEELRPSKKELLLLCQGCPGLAQVQRRIEVIVWAADAPDISEWIEKKPRAGYITAVGEHHSTLDSNTGLEGGTQF